MTRPPHLYRPSDGFICPEHGKPMALDAFSGEGGATRGLQAAGYCVTAVDTDPNRLKHNPAEHKHLGDALDYILRFGALFLLIWTSPPCQDYSAGTRALRAHGGSTAHKRLIAASRVLLEETGRPYIIENVEGAREEFLDPLLLCGRMFGLFADDVDGLPLVLERHRLFDSNIALTAPTHPAHDGDRWVAGVYGGGRRAKRLPGESLASVAPRDRHEARFVRKGGYVPRSKAVKSALLGIDGMTLKGLELSIPPIYAEHLGAQVLTAYSLVP